MIDIVPGFEKSYGLLAYLTEKEWNGGYRQIFAWEKTRFTLEIMMRRDKKRLWSRRRRRREEEFKKEQRSLAECL